MALLKLAGLGEPGVAVLQRLAVEDEVEAPQTRFQLQELQRRGWKLEPAPDETL
jgi:hypothetical protein